MHARALYHKATRYGNLYQRSIDANGRITSVTLGPVTRGYPPDGKPETMHCSGP